MGLRVRTENSEAGLSYMARLHRKKERGRKGRREEERKKGKNVGKKGGRMGRERVKEGGRKE